MVAIRYLEAFDKEFWYRLDSHLPETEFENKVRTKMGYKDCGGFVIDIPKYSQPMEMFFIKQIC